MKIKPISRLLAVTAVLSGTAWLNPSPSQANPDSSFYCGVDRDGTPTTMVRHPQHGEVPVIRWVSDYFEASGYDPQTRCELVSQRFQNFKDNGMLQYLTTGRMNRQSVVCVSPTDGGECAGLLFTLKPTSNPNRTLQDLMALRANATNAPLNETGARLYINLEDYIEEAAALSTEELEPAEAVPSTGEGESDSALW